MNMYLARENRRHDNYTSVHNNILMFIKYINFPKS